MTEQWPLWVVESFYAGKWEFNRYDIAPGEESCQSRFMMNSGHYVHLLKEGEEPTAGKNRIRRCRIELEPIEVKHD